MLKQTCEDKSLDVLSIGYLGRVDLGRNYQVYVGHWFCVSFLLFVFC